MVPVGFHNFLHESLASRSDTDANMFCFPLSSTSTRRATTIRVQLVLPGHLLLAAVGTGSSKRLNTFARVLAELITRQSHVLTTALAQTSSSRLHARGISVDQQRKLSCAAPCAATTTASRLLRLWKFVDITPHRRRYTSLRRSQ